MAKLQAKATKGNLTPKDQEELNQYLASSDASSNTKPPQCHAARQSEHAGAKERQGPFGGR